MSTVNIEGEEVTNVNPLDIVGTEDDDTIDNTLDGATIQALGGNDSSTNSGSKVSIDADDGSDTIYNDGNNVTIRGGLGNDKIHNASYNVSIDAGDGDNTISNDDENVSINTGAGNDIIYNEGDHYVCYDEDMAYFYEASNNVTINAGAGNDSIINDGQQVTFIYTDGDGKDLIQGFNETSTLQIESGIGTYSAQVSGDDIIVTVGKGNITLQGAASLEYFNINDEKIFNKSWTLDGTTATYGSLIVKGVKSLDGISLDGTTVTISKASLGTNKVTVSSGYNLKLGSDVTSPKETSTTWSLSGTTATYKQTTTAGYTLADNAITYSKAATKTLATIKGAKSKEAIAVSGDTIKLAATSLSKKVTISGSYAYDFASDYTKATITGSGNADTITANGNNF